MGENDYLITFAILSKNAPKMIIWSHLLSWAKMRKMIIWSVTFTILSKNAQNDYLITFTISKTVQKWFFGHIYYPEQKCVKMTIWLHLPSWAKLCRNDYLIAFAILGKLVQNRYFKHIYHFGKAVQNVSFNIMFATPANA